MAETDAAARNGSSWQDAGRSVWDASDFPTTEAGLEEEALAYFTYRVGDAHSPSGVADRDPAALVRSGTLVATPIVYEDFLPRSAAGIFQSNLSGNGTKDTTNTGADYTIDWFAGALEREVHTPEALYRAQQDASLRESLTQLGIEQGVSFG